MLKLTKTGIGLLTKQYRSVLRKCLLLNFGLFLFNTVNTFAYVLYYQNLANRGNGVVYFGNGNNINGTFFDGLYLTSPIRYLPLTHYGLRSVVGDDGWNYLTGISEGVNTYDVSALNFASVIALDSKLYSVENQLYNYYYTFRVDERAEVIDSASFFQKDFSTLQEVDLQSKNPTHLGAFAKCDEACPRPSERFSLSLSQEQILKNDASVDAGTSRHCLRQFGDVVADLLKNMASKYAKMNNFMNEEVCHA